MGEMSTAARTELVNALARRYAVGTRAEKSRILDVGRADARGMRALVVVAGAMRKRREVWIGAAVVMGLVIVKLFVVELGNVDTLSRVVSFLGVGLLLVVGHFAPVPKGSDPGRQPA